MRQAAKAAGLLSLIIGAIVAAAIFAGCASAPAEIQALQVKVTQAQAAVDAVKNRIATEPDGKVKEQLMKELAQARAILADAQLGLDLAEIAATATAPTTQPAK